MIFLCIIYVMENVTFLIAAIIFGFVFFGPHTKAKEKKDDKKGGGKK